MLLLEIDLSIFLRPVETPDLNLQNARLSFLNHNADVLFEVDFRNWRSRELTKFAWKVQYYY